MGLDGYENSEFQQPDDPRISKSIAFNMYVNI